MSKIRQRGEIIRTFIIENVHEHPVDIVKITAEKFKCSRQAVHNHILRLIDEGALTPAGRTRNKVYELAPLVEWEKFYELGSNLTESGVWRDDVSPSIEPMAENVSEIWHYGFTEMFNNALDHSEATMVSVEFKKTAANTEITIFDNGVGIFKKIQNALGLLDPRHAVLELAKGKFTTDPANHSGEGIFFSSRMFDDFSILSGDVFFTHEFAKTEDWILQSGQERPGTLVKMKLKNHTSRTAKKVFDKFSSGEDYGFTKTVVPVLLTQYGDDNLVSRSQAKRLLARIEKFKVVVFDFARVKSIGQAFADEVFRVFARRYPDIAITTINTNSEVKRMIARALAHDALAAASTAA